MRSSLARAFWITGANQCQVREEALAEPGGQDCLVETLFSGISRGTEKLVWHGRVPPGERERMRAPFQKGEFGFPVKYGYANVGRVVQGPAGMEGQLAFALYPHQDRYVIDQQALVCLPPGVPPGRAILAANMETALNAIWDGQAALGDRIAIVGGGLVGALLAFLLGKMPAASVCLVDRESSRASAAAACGAAFALAEDASGEYDLIFHASGNPAGLQTALRLAAPEATVVELSWYGDQVVSLPLGETFHSKRLTLRSSQVGQVSPSKRGAWSRHRRLTMAVELLQDPALDLLIDGETSFEDLPQRYAGILAGSHGSFCHRIRYER